MAKSYKDAVGSRRADGLNERLACALCGWWRTVNYGYDQETGEKREVRFDKMDVEHAPLWRLERLTGKGRGSHDASIELLDSKTLIELPADLKEQIKKQCERILAILGK